VFVCRTTREELHPRTTVIHTLKHTTQNKLKTALAPHYLISREASDEGTKKSMVGRICDRWV